MNTYLKHGDAIFSLKAVQSFRAFPCYGVPEWVLGLPEVRAENIRLAAVEFRYREARAEVLTAIKAMVNPDQMT